MHGIMITEEQYVELVANPYPELEAIFTEDVK